MKRLSTHIRPWHLGALALVMAGGAGSLWLISHRAPKPASKPMTAAEVAQGERSKADAVFDRPEAAKAYKGFVDKYEASPDKKVQDQVGAARIRLAFIAARDASISDHKAQAHEPKTVLVATANKSHDVDKWEKARHMFLETAKEDKGTGIMNADFGGIKDQALYQAAVCLNAEGKIAEYRAALVDFMKNQPLSPLVDAAYKRLVRLDGKATPEDDALLQADVAKQEKRDRFETSVCGPKCIVRMLQLEGVKSDKPLPNYAEVAKLCGTTDTGTTMEGLRKGLKALGYEYFGFQVSRTDLPHIATPAILYVGDHYLLVTAVDGQKLSVFDPMIGQDRKVDYAKVPDEQYSAVMLLPSPPHSSN